MTKPLPETEVIITELAPGGAGFGHLQDGRAAFILGGIPGETVKVVLTKRKSSFVEGRVIGIIKASAERSATPHLELLGAMPWFGIDYQKQLQLKTELLTKIFSQHHLTPPAPFKVAPSPAELGYRSRLDFSLYRDDNGLHLAHFQAGSSSAFHMLENGHPLASAAMNDTAQALATALSGIEDLATVARLLVIRTDSNGAMIAIIGCRAVPESTDSLKSLDLKKFGLSGLIAMECDSRRSLTFGTEFYATGVTDLTETIENITLRYSALSFTQQNMAAFRPALADIMSAVPAASRVLELYSGSGTIGLPLARNASQVTARESVASAVKQANQNASEAKIKNYHAMALEDRFTTPELLAEADVLVVDPPRAGLHTKLIAAILETQPKRIVYLSCNPVTQARDLALLQAAYKLTDYKAYDFYPQTTHLEGLAVLDQLS